LKRARRTVGNPQAVAAFDAPLAVDRGLVVLLPYRVHGAGKDAFAAPDAGFPIDNHGDPP
jgi:hypothetical protein